MIFVNRTLALGALLLTCCSPSGTPPELDIVDGWARATVAGQTSTAAYVTIANSGGTSDTLLAATAPVPARASLHTTSYAGGVARMRPLEDGLDIPAGETVVLEPGGAHIMVENLAERLDAGETLRLTLRFLRSGERAIQVPIRDAAASGPAGHGH